MTGDVWTVALKEWKEMSQGGSRGRAASLILVVVYGVIVPLQTGRTWVSGPQALIFGVFVPFFIVFSVVADVIAGERERHTLETLLATRLSDSAILAGKVLAVSVYGWLLTVGSLLLALITVNLAFGHGTLLYYPPARFAALLVFSFLVALLAAGLGTLVSLRAATVRQAQQTLTISWLVTFFAGLFLVQRLSPQTQHRILGWLQRLGVAEATLAVGALIVAIDLALLLLARARFRRARLILD